METQKVEYKRSFGKEVIISLVAFANTDGGRVVVGVEDDGKICGVHCNSEILQRYQNEIKVATYPQLFPKIWMEKREEKDIIFFEVTEYPVKPVAYKNRYYKRLNNSNHLLTLEEIVDLQQQALAVSYDSYPVAVSIDSLDKSQIERFFNQVNERGRLKLHDDLLTNLIKLKLIQDSKVTRAAQLLFGDCDFGIRIGRFKSASTIIDDNVVKGPLFAVIEEAMIFIKKHINLEYHFDGSIQRKERWQYPLEAIRELLLNCVVHRDYKNFSDSIVKIFDDRIQFTNPGRLYGRLSLEDLKSDDYTSSIRNKLTAEAFYLTGDIERYGTGFVRIRKALQDYPEITLSFKEMGDFFRVDLRLAVPASPPVTPPAPPPVTPPVERLLRSCKGIVGRAEMQQRLGISDKKYFLNAYLKPALKAGLVEMTIPDKPNSPLQQYRLTEAGEKWLLLKGEEKSR